MYTWNDGTDVLMHHGIKGQKWGIRRFQNDDGSLTEAGKKRYGFTGRIKGKNSKESSKYSKQQSLKEREAILNSKVSAKEKARALEKMGFYEDARGQYKKSYDRVRTASVLGGAAYIAAAVAGSAAISKAIKNGKMSYETGSKIAQYANKGRNAAVAIMGLSMMSSKRGYSRTYWKFDENRRDMVSKKDKKARR